MLLTDKLSGTTLQQTLQVATSIAKVSCNYYRKFDEEHWRDTSSFLLFVLTSMTSSMPGGNPVGTKGPADGHETIEKLTSYLVRRRIPPRSDIACKHFAASCRTGSRSRNCCSAGVNQCCGFPRRILLWIRPGDPCHTPAKVSALFPDQVRHEDF